MKTIMIKGKPYIEVKEKLKHFRKEYPNYSLQSDIVSLETCEAEGKKTTRVVVKSWITDEEGFTVATGHAYEDKDSTYINKTSFLENCETSAFGRALSCLGIGLDKGGIASADEMRTALSQDKPPVIQKPKGKEKLNDAQYTAMMVAIGEGNYDQVKKAMPKYIISKEKETKLNKYILTKSKENEDKKKPPVKSKSSKS